MTQSASILMNTRSAGVLAHLSCMPGRHGIGNLGRGARQMVDFLADNGFHYWQICPVGPTGFGDSPYQSFSSFAGNPYFIDLDELIGKGFLNEAQVEPLKVLPQASVDYGELYARFPSCLKHAKAGFDLRADAAERRAFKQFCKDEASWLDAYALFMALKEVQGGRPWNEWPMPWRNWDLARLQPLDEALEKRRELQCFIQYCFYRQYADLRGHARSRGIGLIGDIPIFVAYDSADCWSNPELFTLDAQGNPLEVAGVPPDYFSEYGQLWGNPLYDWDRHRESGYAWWLKRLELSFRLYDVIRLDHFRGFDSYWAIPAGAPDARVGKWKRAPGEELFRIVSLALPQARFIAEDLGYINADVHRLRCGTGFPGMKVLQFGFGHDPHRVNLPHAFERHSVVYTGTHDNDTTRGWLSSMDETAFRLVRSYFGVDENRSAWPIIQSALASVCDLAVIPLQDLMDLPSEARFNRPGSASGNWSWRFGEAQLQRLEARRGDQLRYWMELYGRSGIAGNHDFCQFSDTPAH
jgi:4-alpha-glucanotransferase